MAATTQPGESTKRAGAAQLPSFDGQRKSRVGLRYPNQSLHGSGRLRVGTGPSGWPLRFAASVRHSFNYLEADFGFRCALVSHARVRYQSVDVFVDLTHEAYTFEVGVDLGRLSQPEEVGRPYELRHIIGLSDEKAGWDYRRPWADRSSEVTRIVREVAGKLRIHGESALRGDAVAFEQLARLRDAYDRRRAAAMTRQPPS